MIELKLFNCKKRLKLLYKLIKVCFRVDFKGYLIFSTCVQRPFFEFFEFSKTALNKFFKVLKINRNLI